VTWKIIEIHKILGFLASMEVGRMYIIGYAEDAGAIFMFGALWNRGSCCWALPSAVCPTTAAAVNWQALSHAARSITCHQVTLLSAAFHVATPEAPV
jgi:hypothetical protein